MRECIKAFANIIAADFGMKLLIWRNSRSWWKQVLTTDEICLSKDKILRPTTYSLET